jgi:hypothetical protein
MSTFTTPDISYLLAVMTSLILSSLPMAKRKRESVGKAQQQGLCGVLRDMLEAIIEMQLLYYAA